MDIDTQISSFIARFTPDMGQQFLQARAHLRALVPCGFELVYDNYNALVFGYGPSARAGEALLSIAAYPRWVNLFFLQGVGLDDPQGLLQGSGSRVRHVRLQSAATLALPAVQALLAQALAAAAPAFERAPPLSTVLKAVSARQRPRRPAEVAETAAALKAPARRPRPGTSARPPRAPAR